MRNNSSDIFIIVRLSPEALLGSGSYCRIEQRPARQPHKLEDGGSNPSPALIIH